MSHPVYFIRPGHCTRCAAAFAPDAIPYMVREKVAQAQVDPSIPRIGRVPSTYADAPVCEGCATP